ncbi:MAG: HAD-IIIA family hydrolase, partial [Thermodesulfovibrionales bacterium]|nr:HAD-IIIA family hydrolase [Thermodesulfovibrionales bacterium]
IGVSNQSGISRGLVEENFAKKVNDVCIEKYGFDGFYYCPHHPDEYCSCRKPEPGMALKARIKHGIDLKRSYVVGDKEADMLLAKAVGAKAVLVLTGQAKGSENADFTASGLKQAVDWITAGQ